MHQFGIACVPCASNVLAHYVEDIREMGKPPETPNPKPEREMGKREKKQTIDKTSLDIRVHVATKELEAGGPISPSKNQ